MSKFLLKGLHHPLLLFLLLGTDVTGVVGDDFSHFAHHVSGQLAFDEISVTTNCQCHYYQQGADCKQEHNDYVLMCLWCHYSFLEPFLAIFWRRGKAFTDSHHHIVNVQISLIDHAIDSHLRETIEAQLYFSNFPSAKGIVERVYDVDIVDSHHLEDGGNAIIESIPISITILIEKVHIFHPNLWAFLEENSLLMDLLSQYPLAYSLLSVLKVIAAEIQKAIIAIACLAGNSMVNGLDVDMCLQMRILLAELPQENIATTLGCREEKGDCADLCLRDRVVDNYFNFTQIFKRTV